MAKVHRRGDPIEPEGSGEEGRVRRAHPRREMWLNILVAVVAILVSLVFIAIIYLQTERGRVRVEGIAIQQLRALLTESAELNIDRVGGTFITGAYLIGVEVLEGSEKAIEIDTLYVRYNLTTLLRRTFSASTLKANGVRVWAREGPAGSWNLARIIEPADEPSPEPTSWTVAMDNIGLRGGAAQIHFFNPDRDSLLVVAPLEFDASGLKFDRDGVRVQADTLVAIARPPVRDGIPMLLATAGAVDTDAAELRGLLLQSRRSDVRVSGIANWVDGLTFDGDLQASPITFEDIQQFVDIPIHGVADVRLQSQGAPGDIVARLQADFRDHGQIALSGAITTDPNRPTRYAVDGSVTNLDPGLMLGQPDWRGNLTGTLDVDVAGPTMETISGDIDVQIRGSEFAQQRIVRADLVGEFDAGRLNFTLGAAVRGARVLARGTTSPFEDVIPYDVRGEINELDLAALTNDPENQTTVRRATFDIRGRGTDPETLRADGTIIADAIRVGDVTINAARVRGVMDRGLLDFNTDLALGDGGGAVAATGSLRPFAEPLAYDIDEAVLSNVNVAALTGNPDHDSDLTGRITISGVGTDPQAMRADFAARLTDSRWGDQRIPLADATGTLAAGNLNLDASLDLGAAGRLTMAGNLQPFVEPLAYDISGTVSNLNLAALLDDPDMDSDLSGTYSVAGAGVDPQTLVADFRIDLRDSRYREQYLTAGIFEGRLSAGTLTATIDATTPEGMLAFTITGRPFDDEPAIALSEGSFTGLNLALLLDIPWLQTDLTGQLELDYGTAWDPATATAGGRILLEEGSINAARLESGLLEFELAGGETSFVGAIDFEQGDLGIVFAGRPFDELPTYTVDARLDSLDMAALMGDRPGTSYVNAEVEIDGRGFDPETMVTRAQITMTESRFPEGYVQSLDTYVVLDRGVLDARRFELSADFADASASGQVALFDTMAVTNLHFTADIRDAGPIDAFTEQELTIESANLDGSVTGPAGGPIAIDANMIVRRFTYGEYGVRRLDGRVNAEYTPYAMVPLEGRARVRFDFLSLPTFNVRDGEVSVSYLDEEVSLAGRASIDDFRDLAFSAHFETEEDPTAEYQSALLLDELTIRVGDDRWEMLQPARISIGDGAYLVRNFLLYSGDQQIAADGRIGSTGPLTLVVTAEEVRIDPFTDLFGYDGVGGLLTTTLALSGTADDPDVDGLIEIAELTSRGEEVGALSGTITYDDQRLEVDALLTHIDGQTFAARGFLPVALRFDGEDESLPDDAPVDLVLASDGFPIAWAEPFLPPRMVEEIGGTLVADVNVRGTQSNPLLQGQAAVSNGRLALEATGDVTFRDIALNLDFDGNVARLTSAQIGDGRGGRLDADGTITLTRLSVGELDLRLVLDNFRAIDTQTYRGLVLMATRGQNLRFAGTLTDPILTGNLTLASGDIYVTEELMGPDLELVELTQTQIQRLEETFGIRVVAADTTRNTFVDNLDLDVGITIERNVWLRSRQNPRFDIEFFGNIDVVKPPQTDFSMFGTIEVLRGRVELPTLAGRAFNIGTVENTYGQLTFNGPVEETIIDLRAGLQAPSGLGRGPSATVYIGFTGRMAESPELTLTADPPMETADIACVVATGRPCGEAFQGRIAEEIAFAQLGALVQGIAAQQLGLDVVEVEQRPTGEIVLTLGSYVSDRAFAAVSQPITEPRSTVEQTASRAPEVLIEYELLRWLMLRMERRNVGGVGGTLLFQYEY